MADTLEVGKCGVDSTLQTSLPTFSWMNESTICDISSLQVFDTECLNFFFAEFFICCDAQRCEPLLWLVETLVIQASLMWNQGASLLPGDYNYRLFSYKEDTYTFLSTDQKKRKEMELAKYRTMLQLSLIIGA